MAALTPERVTTSFDLPDWADQDIWQACRAGRQWRWEGVDFAVLHPDAHQARGSDNDRSCVLQIAAGDRAVLIAGDITARVERRLAARLKKSTLVFAPHHGSRTSSSIRFLRATQPRLAFFSAPRRSRYGHPHPQVLQRYSTRGVQTYVTGRDGALIWSSNEPSIVESSRHRAAYWYNHAMLREGS